MNRRVAVALLRHLGHEPDLACDGEEACEMASRARYDLVLMDLRMPRLDGFEAARRIRARCGPTSPRIVALTANPVCEEWERCQAAGIDECLVKPVSVPELAAALRRAVGGQPRLDLGPAEELGPEGLREMAAVFLVDAPELLRSLQRALAEGQAEAMGRAAHALKGSFLVLGAGQAVGLCHDLERMAREGGLLLARERVHELEGELERMKARLEQVV